ncbi:MAG: hypothetical protein R3E46_18260 [Sedimenticolaceae bacterium]
MRAIAGVGELVCHQCRMAGAPVRLWHLRDVFEKRLKELDLLAQAGGLY